MKIWLYTVTHNEAKILPFFLRHYEQFCDRIIVFDDRSTDGTQDIIETFNAQHSAFNTQLGKVCMAEWRPYPFDGKLDDRQFIQLAKQTYPEARGQADWVIWCDPDEFLFHPKLLQTLELLMLDHVDVPLTRGFQMIADHFPVDGIGRQLTKMVADGIEDPVYAKPVIFRPSVDMNWEPGKHYVHGSFNRGRYAGLKVLHYRCLGMDYLRERHARNYKNCSPANLAGGLGVGVYPGHTGHMSEPWFQAVLPSARNVLHHSTFHELVRVIHGGESPFANGVDLTNWPAVETPDWGSEHPWFLDTITKVQPQVLIEVGTFLGGSAMHTAKILKAAGLDSALICVDTWLGDHEHWTIPDCRRLLEFRQCRPGFYKTFLSNVHCAGLSNYIIPVPIDSVSGAKLLSIHGIKADMIYIDGGHEGGEVYRDVANYWTLLRAGGAMLFDDYADGRFPGLTADVDRFAREQGKRLEVEGHKARIWR